MPAERATCAARSAAPPIDLTALHGHHGRAAPSQLLKNAGDEAIDTQIIEIDDLRGEDIVRPLGVIRFTATS
jgi:hypothetical protein